MIYDRLGQRIVPGSLMVRIETNALFVALHVWRDFGLVHVSLLWVEAGDRPAPMRGMPSFFGNEGEHLRMVEVIRYVELF